MSWLPLWVVCENSYELWRTGRTPAVRLSQRAESEVAQLRALAKEMVGQEVQTVQLPQPPSGSAFEATEETLARVAQIKAAAPHTSHQAVLSQ